MAYNNRVRCLTDPYVDPYVERRYPRQDGCYVYGFLRWAVI
jgi:hypothetical protein